jgi:hypothetical protein
MESGARFVFRLKNALGRFCAGGNTEVVRNGDEAVIHEAPGAFAVRVDRGRYGRASSRVAFVTDLRGRFA